MKRVLWYAVICLFLALITASCTFPKPSASKTGEKAADFTLPDLKGKPVSLKSILGTSSKKKAPKAVLIDFWATWCPPCREATPKLQKLQNTYGKKGLVVVGVALDKGNSKVVNDFAKKGKLTYLILKDPTSKVAGEYHVRYLPTMYLLDKNGNIIKSFTGFSADTEKDIEQSVTELLK